MQKQPINMDQMSCRLGRKVAPDESFRRTMSSYIMNELGSAIDRAERQVFGNNKLAGMGHTA